MNIAKLVRICGTICGVAMLALVSGCSDIAVADLIRPDYTPVDIAVLVVERINEPDRADGESAEIDLRLTRTPASAVSVRVAIIDGESIDGEPIDGESNEVSTTVVRFDGTSDGSDQTATDLTRTVTFTTGEGADIPTIGTYTLQFTIANEDERGLISLPTGTKTLTVTDTTVTAVAALPLLELSSPSVNIDDPAAEVVVSAADVPTGPVTVTITATHSEGSGTPAATTATLNADNSFRVTVSFPSVQARLCRLPAHTTFRLA